MSRKSISITAPNEEWLNSQLESNEYSSKSEIINDLIRQARKQSQQMDLIRQKLNSAEEAGFTVDDQATILEQAKKQLNGNL